MSQNVVSGLYDFPAREYSGNEGRWPSPDPAGLASANPADPQTWNRYAYVRNSPLMFTDPTGMGDNYTGQNGEDPYCQYVACGGGMPDYSATNLANLPFGGVINVFIPVLAYCPMSDPSCAMEYPLIQHPIVQALQLPPWLVGLITFQTNFSNPHFFIAEFGKGGCLRDFAKASLAAANPFGNRYSPSSDIGGGAMEVGDQTRAAAATAYAFRRGLVMERKSSVWRSIRGGIEATLAEGALAFADASMIPGALKEYEDATSGVCK